MQVAQNTDYIVDLARGDVYLFQAPGKLAQRCRVQNRAISKAEENGVQTLAFYAGRIGIRLTTKARSNEALIAPKLSQLRIIAISLIDGF